MNKRPDCLPHLERRTGRTRIEAVVNLNKWALGFLRDVQFDFLFIPFSKLTNS